MKPNILIFSGAGLSAESGVSTFRGQGGLWNNHSIDDVCNYQNWRRNYNIVHSFYDNLRVELRDVQPHIGFDILNEFEKYYNVHHFTTNVDDLYEKSGISCVHIHGELTNIVCEGCGVISNIGYNTLQDAQRNGLIKHSETCLEAILKPGVIFYNEGYDLDGGFYQFKKSIKNLDKEDVVLLIGSSLEVIPVDYWLRNIRCHKYNINPQKDAGFGKDYQHWKNIRYSASEGLEIVMETLKKYLMVPCSGFENKNL